MAKYRVCDTDSDGRPVGVIDLPSRQVAPGEVLEDPPAWLVQQGYVEKIVRRGRQTKGAN